jgi:acyl transferase domain-containing protein
VLCHDAKLLRITKKDARFMGTLQQVCLESVWRAIEDAGMKVEDLYRSRTGVFVGAYAAFTDHEEAPDDTNLRSG